LECACKGRVFDDRLVGGNCRDMVSWESAGRAEGGEKFGGREGRGIEGGRRRSGSRAEDAAKGIMALGIGVSAVRCRKGLDIDAERRVVLKVQ